jgi:hypothetical protein
MWLRMDHPWRKRGDLFNVKKSLKKPHVREAVK